MTQELQPPNPAPIQILLVEDDPEIARGIIDDFTARGYNVTHCADGNEGLALAQSGRYRVLIVDRNLPGLDGLAILERLRGCGNNTPALVLSALGEVEDRIDGLRAGGDDYLPKPFHLFELVARIEALLRRSGAARDTALRLGPLELDLIERTARRGDRAIELLPREFKLLEYFMRHPAHVITRAMLLEEVWNYNFLAESNVVDVHVSKLRRKIDGPGESTMLRSVRGSGFMLCKPE